MGRQAVVGIEQLHPSGGAVGKTSVSRIPGGLFRSRTQEFIAQRRLQKLIRHVQLIIAEIGELIVFRLQQQNVVETDLRRVVGTVAEELAALQHDCFRSDAFAFVIDGITVIRRDAPGGPGPHRVSADRHSGLIDIVQRRKIAVSGRTAAGGVFDLVAGFVPGIAFIEKREVGEIHHQTVALGAADLLDLVFVAEVGADLFVDETAVQQTGGAQSMPVFVQTENDRAAARKFDRIGSTGLVVILITVQQQHGGRFGIRRCVIRLIKLVRQNAGVGRDLAVDDLYLAEITLDQICAEHACRCQDQADQQ